MKNNYCHHCGKIIEWDANWCEDCEKRFEDERVLESIAASFTYESALARVGRVSYRTMYLVGHNEKKGIGGLLLENYQYQEDMEYFESHKGFEQQIKAYKKAIPCTVKTTRGAPSQTRCGDWYNLLENEIRETKTGRVIE